MTTFAWIEGGKIRDLCEADPSDIFHPDIAALYSSPVPEGAKRGDGWDGATISRPSLVDTEPLISVPTKPPTIKVSPVEFKLLFTSIERLAIKALGVEDPIVGDVLEILDDPRLTEVNLNLQSNVDYLSYLVNKGVLEEDRVAEILTGVLK